MGELEKRIMERLSILYRGTKLPVFINLGEAIKGDLEEAEKEFPKEPRVVPQKSGLNVFETIYVQYYEDVKEWCRKWL